MDANEKKIAADVDEYISDFSKDVQDTMQKIRKIINETVPEITEKISWGMPTFVHNGIVIQFAGHKAHIGLYPGPKAIEVFAEELKGFNTTKGGIQLPYGKPVPYDLIEKITKYNNKERNQKK